MTAFCPYKPKPWQMKTINLNRWSFLCYSVYVGVPQVESQDIQCSWKYNVKHSIEQPLPRVQMTPKQYIFVMLLFFIIKYRNEEMDKQQNNICSWYFYFYHQIKKRGNGQKRQKKDTGHSTQHHEILTTHSPPDLKTQRSRYCNSQRQCAISSFVLEIFIFIVLCLWKKNQDGQKCNALIFPIRVK